MRVRQFLIACAAGLAADQVTKLLAFTLVEMAPGAPKGPAIIPGFLYITLRMNTGISWGFLGNVPPELLIAANLLIVGLLVYFYVISDHSERKRWSDLAVAGIVSGAVGNIIDRIHAGAVLDFIDVVIPVVRHDYPVFNVADILIVVGVGIYIWRAIAMGDGKKDGSAKTGAKPDGKEAKG